MNEFFSSSITSALSEEIAIAGLDKSRVPIKTLDLIPKDQLILIILDILDQFTKQTNIEKCAQFFISYALKKYTLKQQAAKFCQSLEYSIEAHSKGSREPLFLQYLLSIDNNKEAVKFYLKSRKILMQFFFDDGSYRYHDAETTYLELEQWVNVATRIFSDISSARSVERLNNAVVRHAVQVSSNKVRKTIDAVSFLEHCTIEFLRVKGLLQDTNKTPGVNRSVSPINRTQTPKKIEGSTKDKVATTKDNTPSKDLNVSQNAFSSPPKGNIPGSKTSATKADFASPGSYKLSKQAGVATAEFGRPVLTGDNEGREGENVYEYEEKDKTEVNNTITEPGVRRSPPMQDRSLNELKKEKRFLVGELAEQTNERKRIEDNLEKVLGEFSDLSENHDKLVDFTSELHKNFLYLMDYLKAKNSVLMEDTEVQEIYGRLNSFDGYEKNHIDKLNKTGMFKNRESFLENMQNKKGTQKKAAH